jgi:colanic acid biosynthesis glycosyl transferase WcaI
MAERGAQRQRPHVLVLTYFYRPEPNFITADVAEALAERADVTVIAPQPNYPDGRVYPGYPAWRPQRRVENGVTVWRVPHLLDRSKSPAQRALSYGSFTAAAALLAPFVSRADLVWVYHTPFTTALAALPVRLVRRSRIVFTSADLWPESFNATGVMRPGRVVDWSFAYSRWVTRLADAIICSTRGTLERYAADGYPRDRLFHVPVWTEGTPTTSDPVDASRATPTIVYAGNLGPAQALECVVEAAALLRRAGVTVEFDVYGTGSSENELRDLATRTGATNVRFHGRVSAAQAFAASRHALAQIVSLRQTPSFDMTVPSKLFTAMAAGSPILAGLRGESLDIAMASGGAVSYESDNPESLVRAIRSLLAMPTEQRQRMSDALQARHRLHYDRRALIGRYRQILLRDLVEL